MTETSGNHRDRQRLRLRVDMREKRSPVVAALAGWPELQLEFAALSSADYVLSDTVGVERKAAADFAASIMDRRLFGQAARMRVEFERPVLILEGDLAGIRSAIEPAALRSALSFLAVIEGITVLQTPDAQETAALLHTMARHAQTGLGYQVALRGPKPGAARLYAEYLVEGLPGVGPSRARQLLAHFGSPAAVMRASVEQLGEVRGVGPKSAQQIWQALNASYARDQ